MTEGMTVQDLLLHFSNHAYAHGEKIASAEVIIDDFDANSVRGYKIDDITYNEEENKFHVKVEEEG